MNAIVSPFALLGRRSPSADYEALRAAASANRAKTGRRRGIGNATRWTGSSDVIESPARFAA